MSTQDKGPSPSLPKFGEWDVNNPASAEGFTVIFSKKSNNGAPGTGTTAQKSNSMPKSEDNNQYPPMKKWFCCF